MNNQTNFSVSSFDAIKIPELRNLVTGRFCFVMALRMMTTLLGWWIYNLTNAPFAIGLLGLSEVVPAISLALYAGHIIDLSDKKTFSTRHRFIFYSNAVTVIAINKKQCASFFKQYISYLHLCNRFLHWHRTRIYRTGI